MKFADIHYLYLILVMTISVLQKILIRLVLLSSEIFLSTQVMSQEMDTLLPGMTLDSSKKVEGEN